MSFLYRKRIGALYCSLCGEEIPIGHEYWVCNGSCICKNCLVIYAQREFAPCRNTRGEETHL